MGEIKTYASSLADLAEVGAELFERVQSIASSIDPDVGWDAQEQYVRDGICMLFAMVRNRTNPALEHALRYLWNAWSDAEGEGQPEAAVFGPDEGMREYLRSQGEQWNEAPPDVQAIVREVLGLTSTRRGT